MLRSNALHKEVLIYADHSNNDGFVVLNFIASILTEGIVIKCHRYIRQFHRTKMTGPPLAREDQYLFGVFGSQG